MNNETQHESTDISNEAMNDEDTIQYLTFKLDGESYATEITKVREVLEHTDITRVPRTPEYMLGVINLRGNVVPVMDLRKQFDLATAEVTVDTCIIIVEVNIEGQPVVIGALADSVQEVIDLRSDQMEPAPTLGTRVSNKFIKAMGKTTDDSFIIILNMDKVFSVEQIHEAEKTSAEQSETTDNEAA